MHAGDVGCGTCRQQSRKTKAVPVSGNQTLADIVPYRQGRHGPAGAEKVIRLSANELPYPPSPSAVAAFHGTGQSLGRYPDGTQADLRRVLADVHGVPEKNIFAGNGSEEAIGLVIRAALTAGDAMVVNENSFVMAEIHARSVGAEIVKCVETDHRPDVDAMLAAVTERTRIVYICTPGNSSGTYATRDELRRLEAGLPENVLLLVDAAYAEFVDASDYGTGQSLFSAQGRVVMTRTFSKAYGLAALRIGWALAPDDVIDAVTRLRTPFNTNAAALNAAAAAALDQDYLKRTVARINATRNSFSASLRKIGLNVVPSQANFVLVTFPAGGNEAVMLDAALHAAGILGRPTEGDANEFRISIGTDEEMDLALEAIQDWVGGQSRPMET